MKMTTHVLDQWHRQSFTTFLLVPFSWIFRGVTLLRRFWYTRIKKPVAFNVPVIVVGNITVGGTGKTPLVAWLVEYLKKQGFTPGIVIRGYKGRLPSNVIKQVQADTCSSLVGDEAVLLYQKTRVPVVVGQNRVKAAQYLLKHCKKVDVIISDDGLQHYALARDIEIAVIDGQRRLGNGFCLPAGPLRERPARLKSVDFVVVNGVAQENEYAMRAHLGETVQQVNWPHQIQPLANFKGKRVHAVAGIGNPDRFFNMLRAQGIELVEHVFSDHHRFVKADILFTENIPILMTEKDAVKCRNIATNKVWSVPLAVELPPVFCEQLLWRLADGQEVTRNISLSNLQAAAPVQEREERVDL
jgi:tetraacyldisaccharide 4'-kinase